MNNNSLDISYTRSISIAEKTLCLTASGASFLYVVVAFGFKGVPGVSRLALFAAAFLCLLVFIKFLYSAKIPIWIFHILFFYTYLALPALVTEGTSYEKLGMMIVVLIGTLSVGWGVQNQLVSYKVIVYGAVCAAILNIVAVHLGIDTAQNAEAGRFSGLMGNPNSLAISMAYTAFFIWIFPEKFSLLFRLLGIFLPFYGMYISGSRKGLLYITALFLIIIVDQLFKINKIKVIVVVPIILAGLILFNGYLYTTAKNYSNDLVSVQRFEKGLSGNDRSYNDRLELIKTGFRLWKESPLIGHGFSQFARISGYGGYAHNNYIEIAVSGGILGLFLFYSIHTILLIKSLRQPKPLRLRLFIFIFTILIVDMAFVSFYDKATMCMLGTLIAVSSSTNEHAQK